MNSQPPSFILEELDEPQIIFLAIGLKGIWQEVAKKQGWEREILQYADPSDKNPDFTAAKKLLLKMDMNGWTLNKLRYLLVWYGLSFLIPSESDSHTRCACAAGDQISKMNAYPQGYVYCP